ncbi:MAG: hypothetical protein AW07_04576 [Candidatus Accumulibacter sp. SK-11]|nr:MAG: hypothetical protein AW07_04576 [Candidatus Accumulibacter sp. SK-11]
MAIAGVVVGIRRHCFTCPAFAHGAGCWRRLLAIGGGWLARTGGGDGMVTVRCAGPFRPLSSPGQGAAMVRCGCRQHELARRAEPRCARREDSPPYPRQSRRFRSVSPGRGPSSPSRRQRADLVAGGARAQRRLVVESHSRQYPGSASASAQMTWPRVLPIVPGRSSLTIQASAFPGGIG